MLWKPSNSKRNLKINRFKRLPEGLSELRAAPGCRAQKSAVRGSAYQAELVGGRVEGLVSPGFIWGWGPGVAG